jgi:hypothetical protein
MSPSGNVSVNATPVSIRQRRAPGADLQRARVSEQEHLVLLAPAASLIQDRTSLGRTGESKKG